MGKWSSGETIRLVGQHLSIKYDQPVPGISVVRMTRSNKLSFVFYILLPSVILASGCQCYQESVPLSPTTKAYQTESIWNGVNPAPPCNKDSQLTLTIDEYSFPLNIPDPILYRVVDKEHSITEVQIEADILPFLESLPEISEHLLNANVRVNVLCKQNLISLVTAASDAHLSLYISDGFRSYYQQQYTHSKSGESSTLPPGFSQHHTGLAIDFATSRNGFQLGKGSGFSDTLESQWLIENAWVYGFVRTYENKPHDGIDPAYEAHHYYYVGTDLASIYHTLIINGWERDLFDLQQVVNYAILLSCPSILLNPE